jgi:NADPH:quinone reductase
MTTTSLDNKIMTCIEISEPGGPEVLVTAQRPVPQTGPGEVLIRVAATGINGPDMMQRKGLYPPPKGASDLLGLEVAGSVEAVGSGVTNWQVGDQICGLTNGGGYAEYCAVDASHCLSVPDGLSLVEAASLPETYFTIWSNIFMTAKLSSGEVYLVHGGAGGLGTTSIQLGKAFGATVVATDNPAARCEICSELGADRVIDYAEEDFVEVVREAYGGADVILDIVGGPYIERNIKASKPDGRLVQLAFALGPKVEINLMPIMLKRLTYTGSTLRSRPASQKTAIAAELAEKVWPLFDAGQLKPVVNTTLPLAEAAEGHRLMETASHTGKIVLTV